MGLQDWSLSELFREGLLQTAFIPSGMANVMEKLGYKTCFWYGGLAHGRILKSFLYHKALTSIMEQKSLKLLVVTLGELPTRNCSPKYRIT